jgi:hypothetical protein
MYAAVYMCGAQVIETTKNEHIKNTHSLSFGVEMTNTSESESSILEVLKV